MRVLFTTQPGEGHLNPLLPLAQALITAGHQIAVACAPSFCPVVESRGLRAFPMGLDYATGQFRERWPELRDVPRDQALTHILANIYAGDVAKHALPDLLAIAHDWAPDVIVRDMTEFGGWLAAETLGIPHASVEVALFRFFQRDAVPIAASLARLLAEAGRPANDVPMRLFTHLHLSFVPPSFQDPAVPLPTTTHALRPVLLDPAPGEQSPPWLAALPDRPTVYATLGTIFNRPEIFEPIITGVRDLDVTLIATLGRTLDPGAFGPQPDNVHLLGYLTQSLLLPHCDAVISHGGFNSVLGTLAYGVPLVLLPVGADQPITADRAAALGVAKVLQANQRTPSAIAEAVQTVLGDPRYGEQARLIQTEIRALPGPERGVELLEGIVGGS